MKNSNFKSTNQETVELLNEKNVKKIFTEIKFFTEIGTTLTELIADNSNDFTKDIANNVHTKGYSISEKQAWCLAFQITNNINVYELAMIEFSKDCELANELLEKKYKISLEISTNKTTEEFNEVFFADEDVAFDFFNKALENSFTKFLYDNNYEYLTEAMKIKKFNFLDECYESVVEKVVYLESLIDKNNYKGERANDYWAIANYNGKELVYNFYDNGNLENLEYSEIKESELKNWYNYKR